MDVINFIWGIISGVFGFVGNVFNSVGMFFYNSVQFVASIFGVKNIFIKLLITLVNAYVFSIIPDLISYYGCRLSKDYRNLSTNEERKEYASEHTYFLLNVILKLKNKKRKKDSINKPNNNIIYSDVNTDDIIQDLSSNNEENSLTSNLDNHVQNENNNTKSNIKLLYSSSIIGKMLRKDVVLERKLLSGDKPVLVDFTDVPKEIFTNHSLDKSTGIKYRRSIGGQDIEKYIDDPSLLQNPKLFEELSLEQLEDLKEKLANDQAYQNSLKGFFTTNDKVLSLRK